MTHVDPPAVPSVARPQPADLAECATTDKGHTFVAADLCTGCGCCHIREAAGVRPPLDSQRPKIICLCGSTRFIETFAVKTWELELEGFIVLGCTLLPSWYCPVRDHFAETLGVKAQRDNHHLQKIDLADEVLVLNVGGYIGESTRNEIAYAESHGKPVKYLEPLAAASASRLGADQKEKAEEDHPRVEGERLPAGQDLPREGNTPIVTAAERIGPPLVITYLKHELVVYLDSLKITSENIGDIRRSLFVPWNSKWNGIVREETASREHEHRSPDGDGHETAQACSPEPAIALIGHDNRVAGSEPADAHSSESRYAGLVAALRSHIAYCDEEAAKAQALQTENFEARHETGELMNLSSKLAYQDVSRRLAALVADPPQEKTENTESQDKNMSR